MGKDVLFLSGLLLLLLISMVGSIGVGAVAIEPLQVLAILFQSLGIQSPWEYTQAQQAVLESIRMPRVLLGMLVGAGLAVSGAAMQGLFRNPLADPALIGVSSGAALAAVAVIVLGATVLKGLADVFGLYTLPVAAFSGGFVATLVVYRFSVVGGRTIVATMLLAGIAINALAGAVTGLLTYVANDEQLRTLTFWSMGSLGGATWERVAMAAPFILLPALLIPLHARALNAILLGESEAIHLGFNIERIKISLILLVALCVGASVSVSGIIGFIGLVVPHLLRLAVGPDHRFLLPASAMLGASLLLAADMVSRVIVAPTELPIGIITAVIGGPFFLWLLSRQRYRSAW
jgi:iron complex transport system permease protein